MLLGFAMPGAAASAHTRQDYEQNGFIQSYFGSGTFVRGCAVPMGRKDWPDQTAAGSLSPTARADLMAATVDHLDHSGPGPPAKSKHHSRPCVRRPHGLC